MKKEIKTKQAIFPMPVLMIATYNEDGSIDVMNAAWGMMQEMDRVALNLTETHKTVENIKNRKAFTVSLADKNHIKEIDYLGMVSANTNKDKVDNTNFTFSKSNLVDAPIINELPLSMECEFIEYQDSEYGCGVIGKIVNVTADEEVINNGDVEVEKLNAICFDSFTDGYYEIGKRVGNAFHDGLELKNKE